MHTDIIGDALLKLPTLPLLRHSFPETEIHWLAGNGITIYNTTLNPLVSQYIDSIITDVNLGVGWREWLSRCPINENYDIVIDTQHKLKATLLLKRLKHQLFISPAARFMLSDRKPETISSYSGSLQARIKLLFKLAGCDSVHDDFQLKLPDSYFQQANKLLPNAFNYVGVAPGAGGKNKIWPIQYFIEVAKAQQQKGRTPVFFLGPAERNLYKQLKREINSALFPEIENTDQSINGPLLAIALAKKMRVTLANDSGMGHVFNVAGVPLISLFGPTNSEKFVVPREDRIIIKSSSYRSQEVNAIPVQRVLNAIDELYDGR